MHEKEIPLDLLPETISQLLGMGAKPPCIIGRVRNDSFNALNSSENKSSLAIPEKADNPLSQPSATVQEGNAETRDQQVTGAALEGVDDQKVPGKDGSPLPPPKEYKRSTKVYDIYSLETDTPKSPDIRFMRISGEAIRTFEDVRKKLDNMMLGGKNVDLKFEFDFPITVQESGEKVNQYEEPVSRMLAIIFAVTAKSLLVDKEKLLNETSRAELLDKLIIEVIADMRSVQEETLSSDFEKHPYLAGVSKALAGESVRRMANPPKIGMSILDTLERGIAINTIPEKEDFLVDTTSENDLELYESMVNGLLFRCKVLVAAENSSLPQDEKGRTTNVVQPAPIADVPNSVSSNTVKQSPTVKHSPMSERDQYINSRMQVRIAGCDDEGNELDEEGIKRDAAIIDMLHAPQVVIAKNIAKQIGQFKEALSNANGDYLNLKKEAYDFMQLGGHLESPHLPSLLPEIVRGTRDKTYALLIEYVDEHNSEIRIPFAYHFGFTEMPYTKKESLDKPKFPSLDGSTMAGKNLEYAEKDHKEIWTVWRVGVLREITESVAEAFKKLNISVPEDMRGVKGARRGLNNAFKVVYAQAAEDLKRKWITYNTAVLYPPDPNFSYGMENTALRESNAGLFMDLGKRNYVDNIVDHESGEAIVANAEWAVFGNKPSSVLNAVAKEEGVMNSKGGFDMKKLKAVGKLLAQVIQRRQQQM